MPHKFSLKNLIKLKVFKIFSISDLLTQFGVFLGKAGNDEGIDKRGDITVNKDVFYDDVSEEDTDSWF